MSSIRSASSRTRIRTSFSEIDAAAEQVLEPPRRGDDDVGAARGGGLRAEADAAVDGGELAAGGLGDRSSSSTIGRRARASAPAPGRRGPPAAGLDPLDHRDSEGEGLARAGRGLDEQIVAREGVANDHLLDGERVGDVAVGERAAPQARDAEIGKRNDVVLLFERLGEIQRPQNAWRRTEETEPLGGE